MHKKWNGYFTVEASFILPLVLFLYLLIILSALFLYCRCVISQNSFLLGMRAERFSEESGGCGEVIYGMEEAAGWQAQSYVEERMLRLRRFYPCFPTTEEIYEENRAKVAVRAIQKGSGKMMEKELYKTNPIKIIREGRRG